MNRADPAVRQINGAANRRKRVRGGRIGGVCSKPPLQAQASIRRYLPPVRIAENDCAPRFSVFPLRRASRCCFSHLIHAAFFCRFILSLPLFASYILASRSVNVKKLQVKSLAAFCKITSTESVYTVFSVNYSATSTSLMRAISAASPRRGPILTILV